MKEGLRNLWSEDSSSESQKDLRETVGLKEYFREMTAEYFPDFHR